ncbi:MAG: helix-hairpin-helix domain-containing protein [Bacteroidetes bacterium]|nr:helix-hairpin-helix domain-containing protein [Bacteroidota bacterium]
MKNVFRDYFTFNKRERNGVFILLSIICVLVLYLNISTHFIDPVPVDFTDFEQEIDQFNAQLKASEDSSRFQKGGHPVLINDSRSTALKAERFTFDPNNLPETDWHRLGLTEKQIRAIKNYESKGGRFKTKQDLKKMYCIKETLFNSLEPYIEITASPAFFKDGKVERELTKSIGSVNVALLDLNTADSAALTSIKGIGPFYAKSIIKYRNELHGFVTKEQLMEVWKFDQEKFNTVEKYIYVDPSGVKKVNINTCEAAELKSAYIKWHVANAIVNYRKSHGKYTTLEEIKKTDLVDDETYRKIVPYLVVD